MKKHVKKQEKIDKPTPKVKKKEKFWILEYKWQDEHSYNTFTKSCIWKTIEYSEAWQTGWKQKFPTYIGCEQHVKQALKTWMKNYYLGRIWRARNSKTDEIIIIEI